MIRSFRDEGTEDIFHGVSSKKALRVPVNVWPSARRKLDRLNYAADLQDLRVPPGNRLEKLAGNFSGYYSVRINNQFRLIFRWLDDGVYDVEITDYH